jgi:raffinose/stachyose/melibiose transport system substrate-binding protein
MRSRTLLAAGAALLIGVLSGCGGSGSSDDEGNGQVTLKVVAWKGGGTEVAGIPDLHRLFEAQHPNIKLDFKFVARGDYDNYNNPRLAAGDAADVLMLDKGLMGRWQSQGFLADLSNQPWVSKMDPAYRPFNSIGGKTYQFNQENIGMGVYANLDLLKQAGITEAPRDWPAFLDTLRILKANKINGLLVGNKGGWGGNNIMQGFAVNTLYPQRPTWSRDYDQGLVHFRPDWRPAVDRTVELLKSGAFEGKLMQGVDAWGDALTEFKAGKWAFMNQGAWMMSDFEANIKFNFALLPPPGNAPGSPQYAMTFVGTGLGAYANSKHPEAAKEYIAFMAKPDNAAQFTKAEAAFSTLTGGKSPLPKQAKPLQDAYEAGKFVISPTEQLNFANVDAQLINAAQRLFDKPDTNPDDVLTQLDKTVAPTK